MKTLMIVSKEAPSFGHFVSDCPPSGNICLICLPSLERFDGKPAHNKEARSEATQTQVPTIKLDPLDSPFVFMSNHPRLGRGERTREFPSQSCMKFH